jgi:hypothetical protein
MRKRFFLLSFLLVALFSTSAKAQTTIQAASCSESDVSTAIAEATITGDTVVIPAGTCTWTSPLSTILSNSIVIQGAGAETPSTSCTFAPPTACTTTTGTDSTLIVDGSTATSQLWSITTGSSSTSFRLTGIAFQSGEIENGGMVNVQGSSASVRIDHCHFIATSAFQGRSIWVGGWVYGVMDHNLFTDQNADENEIHFANGVENSDNEGDYSWATATGFGTVNWMFVEDNIFDDTTVAPHNAIDDCDTGGKGVLRFNSVLNGTFQVHPTGHAGNDRGCYALEIYENTLQANDTAGSYLYDVFFDSSGVSLVWGNWSSAGYENYILLISARSNPSAQGYTETPPPNGWGYCGTAYDGTGSAWDGNQTASTGYPCLDDPGRGQGDLLAGGNFPNLVDSVTNTVTWPHQYLEPIYEWMNTWTPLSGYANTTFSNSSYEGTQNQDYYAYTTSFNGTSGTGSGTLASRPSTCTAGPGGTFGASPTGSYGVAYWATDQGDWNASGNGTGQGELFVCTAPNTWSPYYTPYTYPHPLTSGSATGPAAPTGLTATPH